MKNLEEFIIELSNQELTYAQIQQELEKQEISLSITTIFNIIKNSKIIPEEIDEDLIQEIDEKIYKLRKEKYNANEIKNILAKEGIQLDRNYINSRIRKIFKEKDEPIPLAIKRYENSSLDEEIYELRKKGMTFEKIVEVLQREGNEVNYNFVRQRCEIVFENKGEKYIKKIGTAELKNAEEIFNLRESGLTYEQIGQQFGITRQMAQRICQKVYEQKNIKVVRYGRVSSESMPKISDYDELIYELRKKKYSVKKIKEELDKKGKKFEFSEVSKRVKQIFEEKNEDFELDRKKQIDEKDLKIYELRKKGFTYKQIIEELKKDGIVLSEMTVLRRNLLVSKANGELQPHEVEGISKKEYTEFWYEMMYELRKKNMSIPAIVKELENQGYKTTTTTVEKVCNRMFKEKGESQPYIQDLYPISNVEQKIFDLRSSGKKYDEIIEIIKQEDNEDLDLRQAQYKKLKVEKRRKQLAKGLIKLIETRKANMEQLEIMADYYGVDIKAELKSKKEETVEF